MRIVMLTESFHPRIGGVEKHVHRLSMELARQGHRVTVLTPRYDPALPPEEHLGPVRILRFPRSRVPHTQKPGVWLWLLSRLPLFAESDLVHVHGQTALLAWYLPLRALLAGKPVFITFHGHDGRFPPGRRHRLERKIAERLTRGNICVGHYLQTWYGTRCHAVTYGAVAEPAGERAPARDGPIVHVGRLEKDTGILSYLQALRLIRERTAKTWKLLLCGDGPLRERLRTFVREHALDVELLGTVPDPVPWIQQSRFVFTSGYLALLEAMICGRLVFSVYENPLKRDYLERMPRAREMLSIAGGAEDLAGQFCEILESPGLEAARVERAQRFAREQTWERLARTCLDLYGSAGIR